MNFTPKKILTSDWNFSKWLLLSLLIKGVLFCIFSYTFYTVWDKENIISRIFISLGDTSSYYNPIESLFSGNGYGFSGVDAMGNSLSNLTAFRMPGLMPVYGPLYFIFGLEKARFLMVLFQYFFDSLSVVLLARIAENIFKTKLAFYIAFFLYAISTFVSIYTSIGYTEVIATAALITSFYYLLLSIETPVNKFFFLSGIFLCWAFFLKPVLGIFFVIYPLMAFYHRSTKDTIFKIGVRPFLVFFLPFFVSVGLWSFRNQLVFHEFIPLIKDTENRYASQDEAIRKFIIATGGDIQEWMLSEGNWFVPPKTISASHRNSIYFNDSVANTNPFQKEKPVFNDLLGTHNPFRADIFTSAYNYDSLVLLRNDYWMSFKSNENEDFHTANSLRVIAKTNRYIEAYKNQKPLNYFLLSKLNLLSRFLFVRHLFWGPMIQKSTLHKLFRISYLLLYILVTALGLLGILLCFLKRNVALMLVSTLPLSLLFVFIVVFGYIENRYAVIIYPWFVLFSSYFIAQMLSKLGARNNKEKASYLQA